MLFRSERRTGARVLVGGVTPILLDLTDRVATRLPLLIGVVVALSFVLLLLVFRSILVPVKAAVLNALSICAAYGAVVAVFQWGWGAGLIGVDHTVRIVSFVPMVMFAILFGLSMDYEVFLLSRIREEWLRTGDNRESVVQGLARTGRIITSAALILLVVVGAFAAGELVYVKQMGLGMAAAIALDVTLVRALLVPATMQLLGDWNWWLPPFLRRGRQP